MYLRHAESACPPQLPVGFQTVITHVACCPMQKRCRRRGMCSRPDGHNAMCCVGPSRHPAVHAEARLTGPAAALPSSPVANSLHQSAPELHMQHNFSHATLEELRAATEKFAIEREWEKFHSPRNLLLALVSMEWPVGSISLACHLSCTCICCLNAVVVQLEQCNAAGMANSMQGSLCWLPVASCITLARLHLSGLSDRQRIAPTSLAAGLLVGWCTVCIMCMHSWTAVVQDAYNAGYWPRSGSYLSWLLAGR